MTLLFALAWLAPGIIGLFDFYPWAESDGHARSSRWPCSHEPSTNHNHDPRITFPHFDCTEVPLPCAVQRSLD